MEAWERRGHGELVEGLADALGLYQPDGSVAQFRKSGVPIALDDFAGDGPPPDRGAHFLAEYHPARE